MFILGLLKEQSQEIKDRDHKEVYVQYVCIYIYTCICTNCMYIYTSICIVCMYMYMYMYSMYEYMKYMYMYSMDVCIYINVYVQLDP